MKNFYILLLFTFSLVSCIAEPMPMHHYGSYCNKDGVVIEVGVGAPNSVGGVTIYTTISNYTDKTIKYVYVEGEILNVFGDKVYDEIYNSCIKTSNITGPIYPGHGATYHSNNCFYNWNAAQYCIHDVDITFL